MWTAEHRATYRREISVPVHSIIPRLLEGASDVRQAGAAFLKMRDRIQRQITQRTEMLAGVSHDLRTPLSRMRLALELMGDDPAIEDLKSDVCGMQRMLRVRVHLPN
jgi:signal transduction histidine kinase